MILRVKATKPTSCPYKFSSDAPDSVKTDFRRLPLAPWQPDVIGSCKRVGRAYRLQPSRPHGFGSWQQGA